MCNCMWKLILQDRQYLSSLFNLKSQWNTDIFIRDATIPFFQIRSDPENSEYRRFRSDPILAQILFFFINIEFLYFCVTLLCVKHNLLDNFILMKNNMKIYIVAVYTWSLHAFCNINPISQNTSGGGLGRIPDELDMCKCIWLLKPHTVYEFYSSQNVKIINVWDRVLGYMTF